MGKKIMYKIGEKDLVEMVEKVVDKKGKEVGQWPLRGWEVMDYGRNREGGQWVMCFEIIGEMKKGVGR